MKQVDLNVPRKTCVVCGENIPLCMMKSRTGGLFLSPCQQIACPTCNPYDPRKDKRGYERRAREMANQNPHLVNVIYECQCEDPVKLKHHFDYSQPFNVLLLCKRCHYEEHKRRRKATPYMVRAQELKYLEMLNETQPISAQL